MENKKYCPFCKQDENGESDVEIYLCDEDFVRARFDDKEFNANFCLWVGHGDSLFALISDNEENKEFLATSIKINYCPMCGRKMKNKEDN